MAISDYAMSKKEFKEGVNLSNIVDLMYNVDKRKKWDDSYKDLIKIEGNDEVYLIRSLMKSPMAGVSEREMVDKRIEFIYENIYYNFSSSVENDVLINLILLYSDLFYFILFYILYCLKFI